MRADALGPPAAPRRGMIGSMATPGADLAARLAAVEDRFALTDLLSGYARGLDLVDAALLSRVLADDVRFVHGAVAPPVVGRAAVIGLVEHFAPRWRLARHHVSNVEVALDGDRAVVRALLVALHDAELDGAQAFVPAGADYEFTAARTGEGWRFTELTVHETWADPRIPQLYA